MSGSNEYYALSLKQPWAWLMTHGLAGIPMKDIENRSWSTSFRGPVLVHASKTWDDQVFPRIKKTMGQYWRPTMFYEQPELKPLLEVMPRRHYEFSQGGIVGVFTITDCWSLGQFKGKGIDNPWFFGPYGFVVKDARPLPFVPLRGFQRFFKVPEEVVTQLGLGQGGP
jgi:hypothetical protein